MVGTARLHADHAQQGFAPRGLLALHDAWPGRHRLSQCGDLPPRRAAQDPGVRPRRHRRSPATLSRHRHVHRSESPHDLAVGVLPGVARGCAQIARHIKQAGGNATWDRLAEHLEETSTGKRHFVINRTLDAPIARVFAMWTDPHQLANWLRPPDATVRFLRSEIAPGKSTLFAMMGSHGTVHVRTGYLAIDPPRCIVYTQQFVDEREKAAAAPGAECWPATLLTTVCFTAETPSSTRVTVTSEAHGAVTHAEIEAFVRARSGMTLGWTRAFDALEVLVQ